MTRATLEVTTMKTGIGTRGGAPLSVLVVAGLVLSLAAARPAGAWVDDSGWGWGYGYYGYGYGFGPEVFGFDETQAWREEQDREAERAKRRDEVEKQERQISAEEQAYYAAVIAQSRASLNAPREAFYRKPGWISSDPPPPTARNVAAGQMSLIYDQGVFWLQRGSDYVAVIPPFGTEVDRLPRGVRAQRMKGGGTLYYYFGTFYLPKGDRYEVVKPPAGTFVGYLPDGYTQTGEGEATTFTFGDISYKQVFLAGALAYQVI